MKEEIPFVSIVCITYNHELYIKKSIEGFLMQKTNFNFEIIIHDDASTDSTADIIRKYEANYENIIKPIYQVVNQYSKKVNILELVFCQVKGKYIAFCEGDDYWTDPLKLQKQVDFLEANPDYGMVFNKAQCFNDKNKTFGKIIGNGTKVSFEDLILNNSIVTLTTCIRKNLLFDYLNEMNEYLNTFKMGDYPMWLYIAKHSKVGFINEVTAVYRQLEESMSHSNNILKRIDFGLAVLNVQNIYIQKYSLGKNIENKVLLDFYSNYSISYVKASLYRQYFNVLKILLVNGRFKSFIYSVLGGIYVVIIWKNSKKC